MDGIHYTRARTLCKSIGVLALFGNIRRRTFDARTTSTRARAPKNINIRKAKAGSFDGADFVFSNFYFLPSPHARFRPKSNVGALYGFRGQDQGPQRARRAR